MKREIALLALPLLICAAPPLVTGAVRDQHGEAIAGAAVTAANVRTQTDAAGLFALETPARSVRISCPFCVTTDASVAADGTVAAIVTRYEEVQRDQPSAREVQTLPYAFAEQTLSLAPFIVLRDSRYAAIGPRLSQDGLSRNGGALSVDGMPAYDPVAGVRPSRDIPGYDIGDTSVAPLESAFRYGDAAGDGHFDVETTLAGGVMMAGSQSAAAAAAQRRAAGGSGAYFDSSDGSTRRFTVWGGLGETQRLELSAFAGSENLTGEYGSLSSNQSGLQARYAAGDAYVTARAWRGVSSAALGYTAPFQSNASTVALATGITGTARVALFADASLERSTGMGDGTYGFTANDAVLHVDAGASTSGGRFDALAGVSLFDAVYGSGGDVRRAVQGAPLIDLAWHPNAAVRVEADALRSIRLPAFVEVYGGPAPLQLDSAAVTAISAEVSDLHRLRVEARAAWADDAGLSTGKVAAAGAFVAWEAAPYLTVRAWEMHVSDASRYAGSSYYASVANDAFTPSSLWLSYAPPSGVAVQLIERRDALDRGAVSHIDAALTLPLRGALRLFAACEHRQGQPYCGVGIRTAL